MLELPRHRLISARLKAGFETPSDAARAFREINQNTLISHENGNRDISRAAAERYGRAFNVEPGWILYGERKDVRFQGIVRVPVVSMVSASNLREQPGITEADIERWVEVADLPAGDWIALEVDGDSMNRVAPHGATIIVNRADDRLLDGKYYVFSLMGGAATFKRYKRDPQSLQPYSTNPDHMSIPASDNELYVFGRVRRVITYEIAPSQSRDGATSMTTSASAGIISRMADKMREMASNGIAVTPDSLFEHSEFTSEEIRRHGPAAADHARRIAKVAA